MANNYSVYKHTTPSGKVYIGLTSKNPKERWDGGHGYKHNPHFWSAIQKYGWNNIKHEIIQDGLTSEEASELEYRLINEYDSTNQSKGYNLREGGSIGYHFNHNELAKRKISESSKRRWSNPEEKAKFSELMSGENNPFYGKHHSEETIEKMKANRTPMSEEQRKEISERLGSYWKGKTRDRQSVEKSAKAKWKPVAQYTKDGEFIKVWDSAKEASEILGVHRSTLCQCCKGVKKSAGGYVWKYAV